MKKTNRYDVHKAVVEKLSRRQIFYLSLLFFVLLFLALFKSPFLIGELM